MVTCEKLRDLCEPAGKDVAVLIALDGAGRVQLVTFGRRAADKVEAHKIKEWVKAGARGGEPAKALAVHESFILDAAVNRERLDRCVAALRAASGSLAGEALAACEEALRFAEGGGG